MISLILWYNNNKHFNSLRSKHFLARFVKTDWDKSKKKINDGGGGGEVETLATQASISSLI